MARPRFVRIGSEPISPAHLTQAHKHVPKVMIWACMSIHGVGRIHVVEGSMNSEQYKHVVRNRLKPQALEWYAGNNWILQQDNAPCHTSRVVKACFEEENIEVLPWPSNSPDMNPIETLWAIIKGKLRQMSVTSKGSLINSIIDICIRDNETSRLLQGTCRKLVNSMPERVAELYRKKGGHTRF